MAHHESHDLEPNSSVFGTVMAALFVLSILYALAVYFDWYRILPGM